ncbi:MAG TPA: PepSY domain-containing protein [Xanthobacteraceae bacterium]|nr:PepSY domain-containing protein [Xanthobacteraceae bacterium]
MRALILLHRWLGVAFCLLFAMWFASGIVMHFVPFPALTEAERFAGLAPIDLARVKIGPADARQASGIGDAARVRLIQRAESPVYLIAGSTRLAALHADDGSLAPVRSDESALTIAADYAQRRDWDVSAAKIAALNAYDQWTVPGIFDWHRPLYRVALNDGPDTELYVSSVTGEIVLDTTRRERMWNYPGSVAHWIYPTALRSHPTAWRLSVWWLSLLALIGTAIGAIVGTLRIEIERRRPLSPYSGWQALHHWLGLGCALFVLTWIFSGWLSMDDGLLFSTGNASAADDMAIVGTPAWDALPPGEIRRLSAADREVEWFAFAGKIYRRERTDIDRQHLFLAGNDDGTKPARAFLQADQVDAAASRMSHPCGAAFVPGPDDAYAVAASVPGAPVFRVVCGADWYDIDGASGSLLEKLDPSRRAYRWLFAGLHTLEIPPLTKRPALRAALIVGLCGCGFVFSLTGVVIAWRRLRSCFRAPERQVIPAETPPQ